MKIAKPVGKAAFRLDDGTTWNLSNLLPLTRPRTLGRSSSCTDLFVPWESEPHAGYSTTSTGRHHTSLRGSEGIINLGLELPSADSSTLLGLCQLLADLPHRVVDESTGQPDSVPTGSPRTSTAERDVVTEGPVPESYSRVDELAEEASHPVHTPRPQRQRRPPVGYPDAEVNVTWL